MPSLLEATRVDGLTTELSVTGDPVGIPSTVDVTGYRIVQESLTNVVRHAGARRACVTVDYQPGRVSLSVLDDGAGGPVGLGGSGLASMAARAQALGGSVQAGPGRTGFEVKAVLPYRNAAA